MKTRYNPKIQDSWFRKMYSGQINPNLNILIAKGTERKTEK